MVQTSLGGVGPALSSDFPITWALLLMLFDIHSLTTLGNSEVWGGDVLHSGQIGNRTKCVWMNDRPWSESQHCCLPYDPNCRFSFLGK